MFVVKYSRNSSPSSSGLIEDISPILRESTGPENFVNVQKKTNTCGQNRKPELDFDSTVEITTKLNAVSLNSVVENCPFPKTSFKCSDVKKNRRSKKELVAVKSSNKPAVDWKEDTSVQLHHSDKSKPFRARKTKKKKDSFIVSDTSSIENDSVTVYHRVLTERIKADVEKITPRAKSRKMTDDHDHGIFTPFISRGKRLSSDSSSSDKENECDERDMKIKVSKTEQSTPKFSKTKLDSIITISNSNSDESTDFAIKKKFPTSSISKPTVAEIFKKELSWCFSDNDSSSSEDERKSDGKTSSSSSKKNSSDDEKVVKPRRKISTNEKASDLPAKRTSIATPITFRLKQLNKLTPKIEPESKMKRPMSFLSSLSTFTSPHSQHPEAEQYKKKFKKMKEELAAKLFKLYNEEVFDDKLPGDMKIEWNARMRSSSGFCYNKRIKTTIGPNNECLRSSRIALSTKIIETPDRLRDTLVHEMCHAAAWIIDNKADGHGPCWKAWASKAMRRFPELPPIKRCHDYAVKTKFKYKCVNCGYTIGRHSKSLNLERKRCGYCYGKFELVQNSSSLKSGTVNTSPRHVTARPLSKFALFVKENYSKVKNENTESKHGDIMKILSKNFAETKISA